MPIYFLFFIFFSFFLYAGNKESKEVHRGIAHCQETYNKSLFLRSTCYLDFCKKKKNSSCELIVHRQIKKDITKRDWPIQEWDSLSLENLIREIKREEKRESSYIVLEKPILYHHRYKESVESFLEGYEEFVDFELQEDLFLVNIHHKDVPLNTEDRYIPGMRTLQWMIPYDYAVAYLNKLHLIHDHLALPVDWSRWDYRSAVSFLIIPAGRKISFLRGYAKPQKGGGIRDPRDGGGEQMRLKEIPQGTIILEKSLVSKENKQREKSYGERFINLKSLFFEAINQQGYSNEF